MYEIPDGIPIADVYHLTSGMRTEWIQFDHSAYIHRLKRTMRVDSRYLY